MFIEFQKLVHSLYKQGEVVENTRRLSPFSFSRFNYKLMRSSTLLSG